MPSVLTEGQHAGEYLISEVDLNQSRREATVLAGTASMEPGTVVALNAADEVVVYDGTQTDLAILMYGFEVDATNNQTRAVHRYLCVVSDTHMVWPGAITQPQKDAAYAAFLSNHVVVKSDNMVEVS